MTTVPDDPKMISKSFVTVEELSDCSLLENSSGILPGAKGDLKTTHGLDESSMTSPIVSDITSDVMAHSQPEELLEKESAICNISNQIDVPTEMEDTDDPDDDNDYNNDDDDSDLILGHPDTSQARRPSVQ